MIRFFRVHQRYGQSVALRDLTFRLREGEFAFLTGRSGAGKTTLLKLIYRGLLPTEGRILVNGRNVVSLPRRKVPYLRREIGVVFQDSKLIDRKTIFENVSYLPRILGVDRRGRRNLAQRTLDRVGLGDRFNAFPAELSGGEQQRVAIARALINEPRILVADEPTGNLDPELSAEIFDLFKEIHRRGTTVLIATHDLDRIRRIGGRVLVLDAGSLAADENVSPAESLP